MPALTLRTARCAFTVALANLITFAVDRGYEVALDEGKVPAVGSKHMPGSLHELGLAQDIILYLGGVYLTDSEDYVMLGTFWEEYGVLHGLPLVCIQIRETVQPLREPPQSMTSRFAGGSTQTKRVWYAWLTFRTASSFLGLSRVASGS